MTSDLKCLRCHYAWKRRTWNRLPRQCPNCHRNDWNRPEVGPVGRPPLKARELSVAGSPFPELASPAGPPATSDAGRMPVETKGEVEAIVRKRYDDAVASLVRGPAQQPPATIDSTAPPLTEKELNSPLYDASTEELLDHLLEQVEGEEIK